MTLNILNQAKALVFAKINRTSKEPVAEEHLTND